MVFDDLKLSFKAFAGIYSTVRACDPVDVFVYRYPKIFGLLLDKFQNLIVFCDIFLYIGLRLLKIMQIFFKIPNPTHSSKTRARSFLNLKNTLSLLTPGSVQRRG